MSDVSFQRALVAGILSFISPCVLPLIVPYAALLISLTGAGSKDDARYKRAVLLSLSFVFGFLAIFVIMSAATSLGDLSQVYSRYLRITGSGLLAILGIYTLIRAVIAIFSHKEVSFPHADASACTVALFIGTGIASGWTPCIGPTLGNILINASTQGTTLSGTLMLIAYAFGLGIPFLLIALLTNAFLNWVKKSGFSLAAVRVFSGSCLVIVGYILATDSLRQLTRLFPDIISY